MEIQLSYNVSDERQIYKKLQNAVTLTGTLREESSITHPVILVESSTPIRFNFCYIPEWNRYYYVREVTSYRNNLYIVSLEIDVLMSFKNDIGLLQVVIDKQTQFDNGDEYIDDGSLVTNANMFNRVYNFSAGFNESPEYILITAG